MIIANNPHTLLAISHVRTTINQWVLVLLALFGCAAADGREEIFAGYYWQEVCGGIYLHAPVNPLAGPVDGNSIVIVNDQHVVVVDTHINPAAARAVIARIRKLTDKPVSHVVNTHWHDDHTNGNHAYRDAFADVQIVSHRVTLAALKKEWEPMEEQRRKAYASVEPQELRAKASASDDAQRAMGLRVYAGYVAALKPELPDMQFVYPDTVFDEQFVVDVPGRRIQIEWLGRGNTDGDVVVWLPDDKLLITGDLVVAPVPFAFDSPLPEWIATLDRIAAFDAKIVIPGHGAVQNDWRYVRRVQSLLKATVNQVRVAHDNGTPYADLASAVDLDSYAKDFAGDDPERVFAWRSYYLAPGVKSAWAALGYPVPQK